MRRTPSLRPHPEQTGVEPAADEPAAKRDIDEWLSTTLADEAARLRASADPDRAPYTRSRKPASGGEPRRASERGGAEKGRAAASAREPSGGPGDAVAKLAERLERIERKIEGPRGGSLAETLRAIEQVERRRAAEAEPGHPKLEPTPADPPPPDFEAALRGFEARIEELSARVAAAPKPIGRRGIDPSTEVASAVDEIRSHQARLDDGPAAPPRPVAGADRLEALSRSHSAALEAMRAEIAKLSGQLEAGPPAAGEADALHAEIETLRDSLKHVVTRDDIGRLVDGIASLSHEIAELQRSGGDASAAAGQIELLQAELRQLSDARANDDGRLVDQIDLLFGKVEAIAAEGAETAVIDELARKLDDIRDLVAGPSAANALTALGSQLSELQREVSLMSLRQVGTSEFNELKSVVESMRSALAAPERGAGSEPGPLDDRRPEAIASPTGSIEAMLAGLIEKLDRVERKVADPDALDQLERQIEGLAARLGQVPERDPALAALQDSMSELLAEVATWRDGAALTAERAARSAVAETLGGLPQSADLERFLADLTAQIDTADKRTQDSLATVHVALDDVGRRVSRLEDVKSPHAATARDAASAEGQRPSGARGADTSAETGAPVSPAWDEVLLEPGAGRPASAASPAAEPERAGPAAPAGADPADIRASLIAAARRASQAASDPASGFRAERGRHLAGAAAASRFAGPAELATRLRDLVAARRRPLLLAAAALVLVLGGLQIARNLSEAPAPQVAARSEPAATTAPASAPGAANRAVNDPATTQSLSPRRDGPRPDTRTADGERPVAAAPIADGGDPASAAAPAPLPGIPVMAAAALTPRPAPAPEMAANAVAPPGLRQAADKGNVVALFDLATRNAEGRGVPRDPKMAASLFEKAAEKGFAPAQYRAGNLYEKGVGVTRDLEAAKSWYKRAAESGNTRAMHNLAVLIAEAGSGKPDYASAITWFQRAAEHGVRDSQFNLAVLYARGLGAAQDLPKSYFWLAVAAAAGDVEAGKKRDEVGARLSAPDLARAKADAGAWRAAPADPAANEVKLPEAGWPEAPIKRASR